MPSPSELPIPLVPAGEHLSATFTVLLLVHILAGLTGVIAGAAAALSPKRRGRHPRFGTIYYASAAAVFLTATGMGLLRWDADRHLVLLGHCRSPPRPSATRRARCAGRGGCAITLPGWAFHTSCC